MTYQDIIVSRNNGVAVVTLSRPEVLNALSEAMREEIGTAFESFQDDDTVRAVVITGEGHRERVCSARQRGQVEAQQGLPKALDTAGHYPSRCV